MESGQPPISVIIPSLNEAGFIEETLESVARQGGPLEIIVADGGSEDETREIAERYGRVVTSLRGRARQMNAGAELAAGEVLLFLHADTQLPRHAFSSIRQALRDPIAVGGTFRLRFDHPSPLLRLYGLGSRIRSPLLCFGDRGLFVRRHVFASLGGFPQVPMFEDLELARALSRRGRFVFLDEAVTTSPRRFHEVGPLRQQLRNAYLWIRYLTGADPRRLTHLYPYG